MPIGVSLLEKEIGLMKESYTLAVHARESGEYEESVSHLTDLIISAGRICGRDEKIGKDLGLDKAILAAQAHQLYAYALQLKKTSQAEDQAEILDKMREVAQGELNLSNEYFDKMMDVVRAGSKPFPNGLH